MTRRGRPPAGRTVVLATVLALAAFAANSVLCRLALADAAIGALAFTAVRVGSGAAVLAVIVTVRRREPGGLRAGSAVSAVMLFLYAIAFSAAYRELAAGTGALILFGAVQVTMITAGLAAGERPRPRQWLGLAAAVAGLVYLVSPGLGAPAPLGAVLMACAGAAWGVYSLRGGGRDPVTATAGNFARAVPLALLAAAAAVVVESRPTGHGVLLGVLSGAVTSGLGYVVWYMALRGLAATTAAMAQLAVPVLAALGGVVLLAEPVTLRLVTASVVTLGGVALATATRTSR